VTLQQPPAPQLRPAGLEAQGSKVVLGSCCRSFFCKLGPALSPKRAALAVLGTTPCAWGASPPPLPLPGAQAHQRKEGTSALSSPAQNTTTQTSPDGSGLHVAVPHSLPGGTVEAQVCAGSSAPPWDALAAEQLCRPAAWQRWSRPLLELLPTARPALQRSQPRPSASHPGPPEHLLQTHHLHFDGCSSRLEGLPSTSVPTITSSVHAYIACNLF